jgi:hypothetical protein
VSEHRTTAISDGSDRAAIEWANDLDSIVHAICADPPGFMLQVDETMWPPSTPHGVTPGHRYDMRCAICRAGQFPEALREVVQAVIDCLPDHALAAIAERQAEHQGNGSPGGPS